MLIIPAQASDTPEIESLLDASFGADRRARTAYRLRDSARPLPGLSLVARDAGQLAGTIQCWAIEVSAVDGGVSPLILLGPVAVAANFRKIGLGRRLISAALAVADEDGHDAVLLIGDLDYYGRFGFSAAATAGWALPGPVDRHRLLLRQTEHARTLPEIGVVRPAASVRRLAA